MKNLPQKIILILIRLYQKTFSFDHGIYAKLFPYGFCRFYPTCSEYAYQAIAHYGLIKGSFKTIIRVLKCHPFAKGGYDPIKK